MSSAFYPISLIESLQYTKFSRTLSDAFEDGNTSTRRGWSDQFFKRQFKLTHAPLTTAEWRYLRAFYHARNGHFDSFWFRDNVHREGNALVRFAADLSPLFQGAARHLELTLEETNAVRALPEIEEVITAAGSSPILWWEPNRELYYQHLGTEYYPESTSLFDAVLTPLYSRAWQAGSLTLAPLAAQANAYTLDGTRWAKTSSNISQIVGTQPAISLFCIARHSSVASNQVVASFGGTGSTHAHGLQIRSDNNYYIHLGQFTGGINFANTPVDTWRSFSVTGDNASDNTHLYISGTNVGTLNSTRSVSAGPFALGADTNGTNISNPLNALTNCNVSELMLFSSALTFAQHKALHNLFAPLYGYATV